MNDSTQVQPWVQQLRTLLLTDLCDSTALVERIGDLAAAELFRDHDRLVLQLQRQWRGELIDRSDGLLLLFERPLDGLCFALDYTQGLLGLGSLHGVVLLARQGLHVGEVLTWRNSDEAVRLGAKSLEVEGLAKPMAARLMSMARPGQLLLSAVAESLTHRAARDLGERGERLRWKSHGRWRFKGIPTGMEIHEVSESPTPPSRAPRSSPKAWRDIPLWRRALMSAIATALLAAMALVVWFIVRPPPAIAFAARDWVVLADVRNLTSDQQLQDSLQQAFRISLEQSRFVNVLSDLKVRNTLGHMRRNANDKLDRATASEIALRDGVRAVLLPVVIEVGGQVEVSLEVIDPNSQVTVHTESAKGRGLESILGLVDGVTGRMRLSLGEKVQALAAASTPLPRVTTANLDALRAYARGQQAYVRDQLDDAIGFFQQALTMDPGFALAYLGVFRATISQGRFEESEPWLRKALPLREHLAAREQLLIDAWATEFGPQPAVHAPRKWKALAMTFPDFHAASAHYAWWQFSLGNFQQAYDWASRIALNKYPQRYLPLDLMARVRLAQNRYDEALALFAESERVGQIPMSRRHASALVAAGRWMEAEKAMSALRVGKDDLFAYMDKIVYRVDRREWDAATDLANQAIRDAAGEEILISAPFRITRLFLQARSGHGGDAQEAADLARKLLAVAAADSGVADDLIGLAIAALRVEQLQTGKPAEADLVDRVAAMAKAEGNPVKTGLAAMLQAENLRLQDDPRGAIALLHPHMNGSEHFQLHVALRDALYDVGDVSAASAQERWLSRNRGRAFADPTSVQGFVPLNVDDSREAVKKN